MSQGDCFTPVARAAAQERVLDAQRSVRYDALLQLIDEVQRRRSIAEVAQVVAARWKHCANVGNWRLLCVYNSQCALVQAQGSQVSVELLALDQLGPFDGQTWSEQVPRHWDAPTLAGRRAQLPAQLGEADGVALSILPLQQGTRTVGMLSVLARDQPFDPLDRKFNGLVAGAMVARILSILTEQSLTAELVQTQRLLLEQRQAGMMGRLVNGVAHEINTPLGVQIACCDALASMLGPPGPASEEGDEIQESLALIAQQAHRAAGIVRRLKQISAAAVAGPRCTTPLLEELTLIAQTYSDLQIQTECPATLELTLDRQALGTVLGELLDNARAHGRAKDGSCRARLSVEATAAQIILRVSDNGPGFLPEQAAHFSDPFFTSRQNQGHIGIGGYIAHNLARDALGATLALHSEPGCTSVSLHFART